MNARVLAQKWLAEDHSPQFLLPRVAEDLLSADEETLPLLLRAMTYMIEALLSREAAAVLIEAMTERHFLPQEWAAHAVLRAELTQMAEAEELADERLRARQVEMRDVERQAAALSAEVERLRAVLAALPQVGDDGETP